jgi:fumarate hydratase, class II
VIGSRLAAPEAPVMKKVGLHVMGNDAAIGFPGSQGNFELNVFKPVIVFNFLHSVRLMADACHSFVEHSVEGITVNRDQIDSYVKDCLMLVTALNQKIGYDNAAKIAKTAHKEGANLRDTAIN